MAEFLGSLIVELCLAIPGAFLLTLFRGRPSSTGNVMNEHYVLSISIGIAAWAATGAGIKFAMFGCIFCQ